jgi:hypothetical protein
VASRESQGADARVRAARLPQVKTLDDFDFSFWRSVKRQVISHLAQLLRGDRGWGPAGGPDACSYRLWPRAT